MKKYYLSYSDEFCYPLNHFKEIRKVSDEDLILIEAERDIKSDFFYCTFYNEVGDKTENTCGVLCKSYIPRNNKNGRCQYSTWTYSHSNKKFRLDKKNKLIKESDHGTM